MNEIQELVELLKNFGKLSNQKHWRLPNREPQADNKHTVCRAQSVSQQLDILRGRNFSVENYGV